MCGAAVVSLHGEMAGRRRGVLNEPYRQHLSHAAITEFLGISALLLLTLGCMLPKGRQITNFCELPLQTIYNILTLM